jgi:hypothetical protein
MANVLNRTSLIYLMSVNTPDFPVGDWVINPDLSPVSGVPAKYWKLTGDVLSEMSQAEKDAVDAAELAAQVATTSATVVDRLLSDPLAGVSVTTSATGLQITVDVPLLGIDSDVTNVTADPSDTKYVRVCVVYNETTEVFEVVVHEKTTGEYADLLAGELLVKQLKEYSVVAAGTDLVEV